MKPLALLLPLLLCACSSPRTDIGNGPIRVRYATSDQWQAAWEHSTRTIYVTSHAGHAWLAHEANHAATSLKLPLMTIYHMVGELPGYEYERELFLRVIRRAHEMGGDHCGWAALYEICGPQAVRHPEIIASIKLQLAMGKK